MIIPKEELIEITGGNITASFVNSITKGITTILDLGRTIGSAIRRITSKTICSI